MRRPARTAAVVLAFVATASCTSAPHAPVAPPAAAIRPVSSIDRFTFGQKFDLAHADRLAPELRRTAGATFYELVWCDVERVRGTRDWTRIEEAVAKAQQLGFRVFLKLRVGSCWATGGRIGKARGTLEKTASAFPNDVDAYSAFVGDAVRRFAARGVHAYAVENEVNARNFWVGDTKEYERLARLAAGAIRAADASAVVFDGGVSSIGYGVAIARRMFDRGRREEALDFYRTFYERRFPEPSFVYPPAASIAALQSILDGDPARRATQYLELSAALVRTRVFDRYQLHYYESWSRLADVVGYVRGDLGVSAPIEAWEIGDAWPGSAYDARVHAEEVVKLLATALDLGISRAIYLPTAYWAGVRDHEVWRGLFVDGTARPAFEAYARFTAAAASGARWITLHGNLHGAVAGTESSATAFVWSDAERSLSGAPRGAVVATPDGSALPAQRLRVSASPVVITWKGSAVQLADQLNRS